MKHLFLSYLFIGFLFFAVSGTYAQSEKYFISFDLASPFYFKDSDFNTTRYRFGYTQSINDRWLLGAVVGYGNKAISFLPVQEDYSLIEFRPEVTWVLSDKPAHTPYLSGELYYFNQKQHQENKTYIIKNEGVYDYDSADYTRNQYGFIAKIGSISKLEKKIGTNFYVGFGVSNRVNSYSNVVNAQIDENHEEHFPPYFRYEGSEIKGLVQAGVEILFNTNK